MARSLRLQTLLLSPFAFMLAASFASAETLDEQFIFQPAKYPIGDWEARSLPNENVSFRSSDGVKLHGWYVPAARQPADAVILYCHGNAGNITHRAYLARVLREKLNATVFLFDYRGYGRSEGKPSGEGVLADARAAREWLAKREGIDPLEMIVMGRSLGGAVAVDVAAEYGARGLILESTFTSIPDVARSKMPLLPTALVIRTRLDSINKIDRYHGPLLISHGDADCVIPFAQGRRLYEKANKPKRFIRIGGADHNSPLRPEYYDHVRTFLDALPPKGVAPSDEESP